MWILALDAALARCSAAVLQDGALLGHAAVETSRGAPSLLPGLVEQALRQAGLAPARLDAVAAVVGPGGFTGLRTALSLAEGLAMGTGRPLVGVTAGEALALALPEALRARRAIWSVVDTRRGRMVLERFSPGPVPLAKAPPEVFSEPELPAPDGPVALAGDAAPAAAARLLARGFDVLLTEARLPDAAAAGRVAALRLAGALPPRDGRPLYAEPPAVSPPARG
jgi:tRNA threonylcarbamoyladenosine biosynthesis protein TsaB